MADATTKEVAVFDASNYEVLNADTTNDFKEALLLDFGNEDINPRKIFTTIPMPLGGGTSFQVDSLDGVIEMKELTGIIAHLQPERALFPEKFDPKSRPFCVSNDCMTGEGDPGGSCPSCPNDKFGPNNEAKRCKESKTAYLLMEGESFPVILKISPGSFKALDDYRMKILRYGIKLHTTETIISLEREKSANGTFFSKLVFKPGVRIKDKAVLASIMNIKTDLIPFVVEQSKKTKEIDTTGAIDIKPTVKAIETTHDIEHEEADPLYDNAAA
jgi:hypothetical protein